MEKLYTPKECAEMLHIHIKDMRGFINRGEIEYIKLSERRTLIPESALTRFLEERSVKIPVEKEPIV